MIQELDRNNLLQLLIVTTSIYYLALFLIVYRQKLLNWFENRSSFDRSKNYQPEKEDHLVGESAHSAVLENQPFWQAEVDKLDEFCKELRGLLNDSSLSKKLPELILGVGEILQRYPSLHDQNLQDSIGELIRSEFQHMNRELPEEDINQILNFMD